MMTDPIADFLTRLRNGIGARKETIDVPASKLKVHIAEILQLEDKVDHAARQKVKTIQREILEGGEEWDVLHRRYYAEEMKKLGIDLARV